MYDGSGNEGCIEKMEAFGAAMMAADTDGSMTISADECVNMTDPMMLDGCMMMTMMCDYNMDGEIELCEFV